MSSIKNIYPVVYDTSHGIDSFLNDLDGLNKLKDLRHEAYYERKESLNEYIIFGRFRLDTCGNFSIINKDNYGGIVPIEVNPEIPRVISYDDLKRYLPGIKYSICSTGYFLPPVYVQCSICEEFFNIKNCHDVVTSSVTEHYLLDSFVGKEIKYIKQIPEYVNKIKHFVSHDIIGSDNYINQNGGNQKGWKHIKDNYVIQHGDKASITKFNFIHNSCNKINIIESFLQEFKSIFAEAYLPIKNGSLEFTLNGIENRYCPCDSCPPWYIAKIKGIAPIIIGWRKSVININWEKSGVNLLHLFESENVTKDEFLIHAYGYKKAKEYLSAIIPALLTTSK